MPVLIREINIQDSAVIAGLTGQLGYKTTVAETTSLITEIKNRNEDLALVAVKDNNIVGWIHAFRAVRLQSGHFVEIGGLVIDEQHRGQGIGNLLIERVKEWSRRQHIATIKVRCSTKRLASHRFYLAQGFTEVKEQKIFELNI